ncbi:hypothetical protein IAQ61_010665 [Plenodomus lingam]|uniref:uncharacterized protein n=1 Tax=Leptosphaeria maculans TaxID=5022 RepID=UPI003325D2EA|nr:hypothetical protein IAQ61_010665 [Plenodomus lingam]
MAVSTEIRIWLGQVAQSLLAWQNTSPFILCGYNTVNTITTQCYRIQEQEVDPTLQSNDLSFLILSIICRAA